MAVGNIIFWSRYGCGKINIPQCTPAALLFQLKSASWTFQQPNFVPIAGWDSAGERVVVRQLLSYLINNGGNIHCSRRRSGHEEEYGVFYWPNDFCPCYPQGRAWFSTVCPALDFVLLTKASLYIVAGTTNPCGRKTTETFTSGGSSVSSRLIYYLIKLYLQRYTADRLCSFASL